uniref:transposase n=1 Tax=Palleronia rufa TaxID=1530186 RepID=UPI003898FD5B
MIPFSAFDPAIRKIIHTTNAIESPNRAIRRPRRAVHSPPMGPPRNRSTSPSAPSKTMADMPGNGSRLATGSPEYPARALPLERLPKPHGPGRIH